MKKFILHNAIIFISFALIVGLLELVFAKHQNYVHDRFNSYYAVQEDVEVLIIGNSHMGALRTPLINGKKSFNFSFGGQDIFHFYSIAKTLLGQENKIEYLLLGIDYDLLGYDYEMANTMWQDRLYYKDTKMLYENSLSNQLMSRSNFFLANRNFNNIQWGEKDTSDDTNDFENFVVKGGDCKARSREHSETKFSGELVNKNLNNINSLIELSRDNNIKLVVVNPPKTSCYISHYHPFAADSCSQYLTQALNQPGISFIDLWKDERFSDDLFVDHDHLNPQGVEVLLGILEDLPGL